MNDYDNGSDFQFGRLNFKDISDRYMQRMLRPAEEAVWDMSTGGLGILGKDGSILTLDTSSKENAVYGVTQNDFAMLAMPIPAFAQQIPVESVVVEDFIYHNDKPFGWVTAINKTTAGNISFEILKPNGQQTKWAPPKVQSLMMSGVNVQVLRTMISMFGGDGSTTKLNDLKDMLMPMMMMGGGNMESMAKMIPMMMMMGGSKMDPMMMMMLMNNSGGNMFGGNNLSIGNNGASANVPKRNTPFINK